eukprot:m.7686 g.7686  ORF g.7686 m.7686 type:complete len:78 (+) comp19402_c0_seq2:646-879(+)
MQPTSLDERIGIAIDFLGKEGLKWPIVVDSIDNQFDGVYSAFPEKLYIFENEKMQFHGKPGPDGFKVEEVEKWLLDR